MRKIHLGISATSSLEPMKSPIPDGEYVFLFRNEIYDLYAIKDGPVIKFRDGIEYRRWNNIEDFIDDLLVNI